MPESQVPPDVRTLAARLAEAKPMRRGSVSERYVKCNRDGCPCAEREDARHGPYFRACRATGSSKMGERRRHPDELLASGELRSTWAAGLDARPIHYAAAARTYLRRLKPRRALWPMAAIISVDLTLGLLNP